MIQRLDLRCDILVIPIGDTVRLLADTLPALIETVHSNAIRDSIYGSLIPYDAEPFGRGRSAGHCVRPDILMTPDGPKIVELDFVASGRAHVLSALPSDQHKTCFLASFAEWYRQLTSSPIYYATATHDPCAPEVDFFCDEVHRLLSLDIKATNIDNGVPVGLLDRLFMRSEMERPMDFNNAEVVTKEPYLDSKMIFALVWDDELLPLLKKTIGQQRIDVLRALLPETYSVSRLTASGEGRSVLQSIAENRKQWVIKNTDVDTDASWGCRGVVLGQQYTRKRFDDALFGAAAPHNKSLGRSPVVQRFHSSRDFTPIWNAVVDGSVLRSDVFGRPESDVVYKRATKHVYARVGPYLLIDNRHSTCVTPPFGFLTLRQDAYAHGASDGLFSTFWI